MIGSSSKRSAFLRLWLEAAAVFCGALGFLLLLAPSAPFAKELGACEMGAVQDVLAGRAILPYFATGMMTHAPPFYWWTAAVSVKLLGWNELALRLPALLAAAVSAAVVFGWLAATMSRRAGLWAAAALLFCHFFADAARQPRMDSMLAMFVTGAVVSLERAINSSGGRRVAGLATGAVLIGLGILTKGPLGIVLPGLVVALYLLVRGRLRELFAPALIGAFVGGVLIGLGWYLAAYRVGGEEFYHWQVVENLWQRFIPTAAGGRGFCEHPFYYFVPHTLSGFLPWTLYIPALGVWVWKRGRSTPDPVIFALCWFAAIFVFFSTSTGKCLVYILPAFPPLAALTGCVIGEVSTWHDEEPAIAKTFALGSAAIAIGALAITLLSLGVMKFGLFARIPVRLHPSDRRFLLILSSAGSRLTPQFAFWLAASTLGALLALFALRRGRLGMQALGVLIIAGSGTLFWFGTMNPAGARMQSLKDFAHDVARLVPAGTRIYYTQMPDCDLVFYSERPVGLTQVPQCQKSDEAPRFLVYRQDQFDKLGANERGCLKTLAESPPVDRHGSRLLVVEQRDRN